MPRNKQSKQIYVWGIASPAGLHFWYAQWPKSASGVSRICSQLSKPWRRPRYRWLYLTAEPTPHSRTTPHSLSVGFVWQTELKMNSDETLKCREWKVAIPKSYVTVVVIACMLARLIRLLTFTAACSRRHILCQCHIVRPTGDSLELRQVHGEEPEDRFMTWNMDKNQDSSRNSKQETDKSRENWLPALSVAHGLDDTIDTTFWSRWWWLTAALSVV